MRLKLFYTTTLIIWSLLLFAGARAQAPNGTTAYPDSALPGFTFTLARVPENPEQHSLVISDDEEHVISMTFSASQLQALKTVLLEAEKFALNDEAVGATEPFTTRFQDKKESGFAVDVEKFRNQSRLFLSLTSDGSSQTAEAGRINRSTKREAGFIFELLSQLEATSSSPRSRSSR